MRYVNDGLPGWSRTKAGKGFRYLNARGRAIRNARIINLIRSLAIPPAWIEVWICPWDNGHLQVVGKDARGRKQYRYYARCREVRDSNKYHHLIKFGYALPRIHRIIRKHLSLSGLPREKVLAAPVRIMEETLTATS